MQPPAKLDDYFDVIHRDLACIGCQDSYGDYDKQKVTVWAMNVLEGEDQVSAVTDLHLTSIAFFFSNLMPSNYQLCQRMTWSLYELLNVGTASNQDNTESNLYTVRRITKHLLFISSVDFSSFHISCSLPS